MPKANILFVHPSLEDPKGIETFSLTPPFGLLSLAGHLSAAGKVDRMALVDMQFCAGKDEKSLSDFILKEADFKPDIVAISYMIASSWRPVKRLIPLLRSLFPKARIVMGGNHATSVHRHLFKLLDIDFLVRGEGEKAFEALVDALAAGKDAEASSIRGVYDRAKAEGPLTELGDTLVDGEVPHPAWELLDKERYFDGRISGGFVSDQSITWGFLTTARGCYNNCTYCAKNSGAGAKARFYADQFVLDEIKYQNEKFGAVGFIVIEEMFNANKPRMLRLLKEIKALGIKGLRLALPGVLYINALTEEMIDALVDMGLDSLVLPVESASPYVLKHIMKKNVDLERAKRLTAYARSKGIVVQAFFIIGLPGEKPEHLEESVRFAKSMNCDWSSFFIYNPLPGSPLYDGLVSQGIIVDGPESWENVYFRNRWFTMDGVTPDQMMETFERVNIDTNFVGKIAAGGEDLERVFRYYQHIESKTTGHVFAMLGMYACFDKRGEAEEAAAMLAKMKDSLRTSDYARHLYSKFGHMIPPKYAGLLSEVRA
jgi:radical SAM superfamily enzyme YgiQ (UPF0313 family)